MQVSTEKISDTKVILTIKADSADLGHLKEHVLSKHAKDVNVAGFRQGKVPLGIVEKNLNPKVFEGEFLEDALNHLYADAVNKEQIRPVNKPQVELVKFVPYELLEFKAPVDVIGDVKLPDYKSMRIPRTPSKAVTSDDVAKVIDSLAQKIGDRSEVNRKTKPGDEVIIDFKGTDLKGNAVGGASGNDYPLVLGSNTFIPGFEDNLIGLSPGDKKDFKVRFPKDYSVSALASKEVNFSVSVKKIQEITLPNIDDDFAKKVSPFSNLTDLKEDIKKQLEVEAGNRADRDYESLVLEQIVEKSSVAIPDSLIDDQVERQLQDVIQNLVYRGQTYQEFLGEIGKSEDEYKKDELKPEAQKRLKATLVLTEISRKEGLEVTDTEVERQIVSLKNSNPSLSSDLTKPEVKQDIASRLLADKTIKVVTSITQK